MYAGGVPVAQQDGEVKDVDGAITVDVAYCHGGVAGGDNVAKPDD